MPVGTAKFDLNRCNESPLRGEKPDFWPVSKNNTGSLPLRGILPVTSHSQGKIDLHTVKPVPQYKDKEGVISNNGWKSNARL